MEAYIIKGYRTAVGKAKKGGFKNYRSDDGDLLVIDRSLEPQDNKIAVCFIDGEFTVKRLKVQKDCIYLMPENSKYEPIKVTEDNELIIWGVVTYVVKKV